MSNTSITPHVASTEEIINYPQIQDGITEVYGMPIISEVGPITPQIVNNRQLIRMFTTGNGIFRTDNISLKLAYLLSKTTNLMVCRVSNTNMLPVIAFKLKTDGNFETINIKYNLADGKYYKNDGSAETATTNVVFFVRSLDPNITYQAVQFKLTGDVVTIGLSNRIMDYDSDGTGDERLYEYYPFSIDPDAVDGYGQSQFIESINNQQSQYIITVNEDYYLQNDKVIAAAKLKVGTEITFGTSLYDKAINVGYIDGVITDGVRKTINSTTGLIENRTVNLAAGEECITDWVIEAINKIGRYRRDLQMPILWDGQLTCVNSARIVAVLKGIATKRKSLGVFGAPLNLDSFSKIKNYYASNMWQSSNSFGVSEPVFNTKDKKSSPIYTCTPYRYSNELGFRIKVPYTYEYILQILSNKSENLEFAPVFGKYGLVDGRGIAISFYYSTDPEEIAIESGDDVPETEQLQRLAANPVIYDEARGTAKLVNNLTFQTPNLNNMSEENNRRLWNKIQFEVNKILDDIIASANNGITREELTNTLNNYRTNVLNPLGYGLNLETSDGLQGFRFDIEPYNPAKRNTLTLTVDCCFNDSIKYVNVLYRDIPMVNV